MRDKLAAKIQKNQGLSELLGTVVAVQANFYQVHLNWAIETGKLLNQSIGAPCSLSLLDYQSFQFANNQTLLCTRRTRLKKIGQQVMVGDCVLIEEPDFIEMRGVIAEVLPRKTELKRPPVANAEQILLVFALEEPILDPWRLSRFLVKAESTSLDLCLCLNKIDLVSSREQKKWKKRLNDWGYESVFISVATHIGLEELTKHLQQKITILAGLSGVGKSSLINELIPNANLRVAEVSGKLNQGRHTTRHVELFELSGGGLIADSPGFNQPELDCAPMDLAMYFPEARQRLAQSQCQFSDCLHRDEPNCVVNGNWERYEHYLKFLEEAIAKQDTLQQISDAESSLKLKIKDSGQRQYEPKLESKKYRRRSRRKKHQVLQELYDYQTVEEMYEEAEDF